jgi:DNA-binding HxlR family transcriptional regulator
MHASQTKKASRGLPETPPEAGLLYKRSISSAVRALDVLSDPWAFLVLREAFFGVRRFDELQSNLMIARNILSKRLGRLVREGILQRRLYEERPRRYEYRLTEAGRDFFPPIVTLMSWGDKWQRKRGGPPLEILHEHCGKPLNPQVVCHHCRRPLSPREVDFEDGPGAGSETNFRIPATRSRATSQPWLRGRPCSVARTLKVIGDRWSLRILREAFVGVKRFEEFQRNLDIARNILSNRLARLVKNRILVRRKYQDRPERFEYKIAAAGIALYPSLLLFMAWGDKWRRPKKGAPLILRHRRCGRQTNPILVCGQCGGEVNVGGIRYRPNYIYPKLRRKTRS